MTENAISDEDLTAYLDGEASGELTARIEAALAAGDGTAARLEALIAPVDRLPAAFEPLLSAAPAASLGVAVNLNRPPWARWASVAALVVLGFGTGFLATAFLPKKTDWRDYVAAYHALYVAETLPAVSGGTAALEAISARIGLDLSHATTVPGLEFRRAQILGFAGQDLVQMAYLGPENTPYAFCIMAADGPDIPVALEEREGFSAASWQQSDRAFILIGGQDDALVEAAAQALLARL